MECNTKQNNPSIETELLISNIKVRITYLIVGVLGLFAALLSVKTAMLHSLIILFFSCCFFFIAITNRIRIKKNGNEIHFLWISSLVTKIIKTEDIQSIDFFKNKLILTTKVKKYKLSTFNVSKENKKLLETYFYKFKS
jgi:hypothetical protein